VLLAANPQRRGFIIENSDANRLHVRLGGTATTTDYSFSLAQNENAERTNYQGQVVGIWAADGSGYAHVSEY
jgi:hypothetical protein